MNEYLQIIAAFTGSAGFALAYNFRKAKHILTAGLGGSLGWLCYLIILRLTGNGYLAGYTGTVLVSAYSEIAARALKTPSTGFLIVTSIPMIPGAALYRCMRCLLLSQMDLFRSEGTYTVLFASCMAAGFVTATIIIHLTDPLITSKPLHNQYPWQPADGDREMPSERQQ